MAAFPDPRSVDGWQSIDDRVMGGRSRSTASWSPEAALVFSGVLSLEQGGGFASIRADLGAIDLRGRAGLRLVVRGDGREYRIHLRDRLLAEAPDDGTQFRATFRTEARWDERWLPWTAFVAVRRGRVLPASRALHLGAIASVGLMTGFREPGPFRLEVRSIDAV